jgi:hypothetical protein
MSETPKMRKHWRGFRIGGLTIGGLHYGEVRGYTVSLLSWHNPKHMCWLWFIDAYMSVADELRAFRIVRLPGFQSRTIFQLWALNVQFVWQEEGRYRDPMQHRQQELAKKIGVKL